MEQVWHNGAFGSSSKGMLAFQDISLQVHSRIKLVTRLACFDVHDFDSRVYAYESDMAYSYSVPAFQNRGFRIYLLMRYKMNKNLHICFRFAHSSYDNAESTGSGQDKINSNNITDTGIQCIWKL